MSAPAVKAAATSEAVLVVLYGPNLGRRYTLYSGETVLGRSTDATIALDADSVSRRHARIVCADGTATFEDLGSTNGSYVNDRKTERCTLRDGDIIHLGVAILKFLAGSNLEAAYHEEIYRLTILDGLTGV